jgi:hypothetical protein
MLKELTPEELEEMRRTGKVPERFGQKLAPQTPSEIADLFRDESGEEFFRCDG